MTSEKRKAANRAYYLAHRDTCRKHQREYYKAHREECRKHRREYYKEHCEECRKHQMEYCNAHPDRVAEAKRKYDAKRRARIEEEYLRRFKKLDPRIVSIGCALSTDADTMEITGEACLLKDCNCNTLWEGKTYKAGISWLHVVANTYRCYRRQKADAKHKLRRRAESGETVKCSACGADVPLADVLRSINVEGKFGEWTVITADDRPVKTMVETGELVVICGECSQKIFKDVFNSHVCFTKE